MIKKLLCLLLLVLSSSLLALRAQDRHLIDSLQNEIKKYDARKMELGNKVTPLMDSTKAKTFIEISIQYMNDSLETSMYYLQQTIALSEQAGYKKGVADAYYRMKGIYIQKNDIPQVFECCRKALKIYAEIGEKELEGKCYFWMGLINNDHGNYPEAMANYEKAKQLYEKADNKEDIADLDITIGGIYETKGNYPEALNNYLTGVKISQSVLKKSNIYDHNKQTLARGYEAIGRIYEKQGDYSDALKNEFNGLALCKENKVTVEETNFYKDIANTYQLEHNYEEALTYGLKALTIEEEFNYKWGIGTSNYVVGNIYLSQGNYTEALTYFESALKYSVEAGDKGYIANINVKIATAYEKLGNFQQALSYGTKGLSLVLVEGEKEHIKDAYSNLAEINAKLGNYKAAYDNEVLYKQYYDSIYNKENEKKITGLQMQYDFDKKQDSIKAATAKQQDSLKAEQSKKDAIATKEIQNQKNIKYALLGGLVLVLVFAGFVFRSLRLSRKQRIEIEKEKQRAEQSEKFKEQFLANMSHEIRTPMNAVNGMTELLLEKQPRADQLNYLEAIRKSSDTLLHIINDILDLSKIEAGKMEMEQIDFSLKDTIEQVRQTLSFRAEEKGLQLITQIDNSIPDVVIGDPVRLNQILVNLGGNAIKFTEKGSVHIKVASARALSGAEMSSKEAEMLSPSIKFSIIDTGIGIPKDKMQQVFENFSQANTSDNRKFGGTGLGLSISKQLVELQGGKISVESEENAGTTFSFILNYPTGSKEKLEQRILSEHKIDGSTLNGLRILIADDNEYNRIVAKDTLQLKAVVQIDEAENGEQVIELLKKNYYDVILMDVQMPIMDGFEATKQIRNNFQAPKNATPIIALTASVVKTDLDRCKQAGMNNYVPKPFKPWQLFGAIAEITGKEKKYQAKSEELRVKSESLSNTITDLTYLHKFCDGDKVKMKKYIDMYLKSLPVFTERIEEALKTEDKNEIGSQVHALKSKLLMMGMAGTRDIAQAIELQCKDGGAFGAIHEKLNKLLNELDVSVEELNKI